MKFADKAFIGKQIQIHRKMLHLTQEQLAEMVDLSVQHVSKIESGKYIPSLKTFFDIVTVLKIDLQIFGFNVPNIENKIKNNLMEIILCANDKEIVFYNSIITSLQQSFIETKNFKKSLIN